TSEEKEAATIIYQTLHEVKKKINHLPLTDINKWVASKFIQQPLFTLEYFTIAEEETLKSTTKILPKKNYRAFIAVYAREIRLIDTISLNS
ncbi:MAG: pantoate--beta-alanine ligase, partial [Flavobacterium sp.]|nr:pantoate--beta-alanine ligase [Flavobacterium sp.]